MADQLFFFAFLGGIVLFLLGPSVWLLVSLYRTWETTPQDERVKQFSHAVAWPMVAIVVLFVASMFATVINPGTAYVDASDYDHARAMWHSDAHVSHFPDTITPHRVHHFYARAIPPMSAGICM